MLTLFHSTALAGFATAATLAVPAMAQTPEKIAGDELSALATGRTWAISFYGNPDNPSSTNVWDFRKDGSVCARGVGSKRSEKCADVGKWSVKGEKLCWELTWMGEGAGTKTACSAVSKSPKDRYDLHNEKNPDLSYAVFKVL